MLPESLDELLQRARRRDPDALTTLVDAYHPRVFGLLVRLTGSRETAEDLAQETFLRLVRTIGDYEHDGRFEPWLFRIAANLARDHSRRRRRRGRMASLDDDRDGSLDPAQPAAGGSAPPDAALMKAESGNALEACLGKLNDGDRDILLLRHYAELSFREIADLLGIPLGTALARAHRALKKLREEFGLGCDG